MSQDLSPKEHLKEKGWAIVKIPDFDPEYYKTKFFDYIDTCSESFDRNDRSTWTTDNLPFRRSPDRGIIRYYIGHVEFLWDIRQKCVGIFKDLWETDDLVCSYDGACFITPQPEKDAYESWFHTDQTGERLSN